MSSSPIPPPTFTGTSKYASDFQQVLARAVSIAALPLQQLQNQEVKLTQQQTALSGLQSTFGALQTAIQNLSSAQTSMSATSSNTSVVTATAGSSTLPGTYSIQVTNLGSETTTLSSAGSPVVTDPTSKNISSAASFTLTLNGTPTTITPAGSSLNDLAAAVNAAGLAVQATVVNVGSTASPDYRLSITSNNLAADTIQLNDGTNNLLTTLSTGSAATYQVAGLATTISSNSRQVTLAPGLTANLLQTNTGQWATITVGQNTAALGSDLSNFATAYNAAVDALSQQHGKDAGALSGNSLINDLGQSLRNVVLYTSGSGSVSSLSDVGLNLDSSGHLSFDASKLNSQTVSALQAFLGSATSGGFLKTATDTINAAADSSSGLIQSSLTSVQDQINNENNLISNEQTRITDLQNTMQQQLSAADAAIAVLQQQITYMSSLFSTMYPGSGNNNIANSNNRSGG